jgi:putative SbcD/Mre11-related phosphoesterase
MAVEPVPGEPAAVADCDGGRALVVADFHAGIEAGLRREGVELPGRADERRESLVSLVERERPDRLVFLGDLGDAIGNPGREEREEIADLFEGLPADLAVTLAKGNHDGDVTEALDGVDQSVDVTPGHGVRLGDVGFAHGHTWPSPDVLRAEVVCVGHEHPVVRLEDEVGGRRVERVWLRGGLDPAPFEAFHDADLAIDGELVVCPGFNDLSGGTWINVDGQEFLSPFLPEGLADGQAYLLDGTRLGEYRRV